MKEPYPLSERHPLIHDRGRGPELVGTRITVFDLLPSLMDPDRTDADILAWYPAIDARQLAAARAYALEYAERLLPEQREWEARPEPTNPPEVAESLKETRERMRQYHRYLFEKRLAERQGRPTPPPFREWLAVEEARSPDEYRVPPYLDPGFDDAPFGDAAGAARADGAKAGV